MKKLLSVLGAVGLTATSASSVMAMAPTTVSEESDYESITTVSGQWDNKTGTVNATNGKKTETKSWDIELSKYSPKFDDISQNLTHLEVNGMFNWGTKKNPETQSLLKLTRGDNGDTSYANENNIRFSYTHSIKASNGWGHQQANITLEILLVKKMDGKAMIKLTSIVAVASQASANKPSTTANVQRITMMGLK